MGSGFATASLLKFYTIGCERNGFELFRDEGRDVEITSSGNGIHLPTLIGNVASVWRARAEVVALTIGLVKG
jgi:hypothetical protein